MSNSGEVLELLEAKIQTLLSGRRLKASDRTLLEIQQLFVLYLREDHNKVATMWTVFKPMAWVTSVALVTLISLVAAGKIEIILR